MPRRTPPAPTPLPPPSVSRQADTLVLLQRVKAGDPVALDHLCERYLPRLRNWAKGRLPQRARGLLDTDDLVQETMIRSLHRIQEFEARNEGALQAYLRKAILNNIRDQARRLRVAPHEAELGGNEEDPGPSPLENAVGQEIAERYEAAFNRLKPDDQQAIVMRLELGYSYHEVAEALEKPSADAARMAVSRALLRLAREMEDEP